VILYVCFVSKVTTGRFFFVLLSYFTELHHIKLALLTVNLQDLWSQFYRPSAIGMG